MAKRDGVFVEFTRLKPCRVGDNEIPSGQIEIPKSPKPTIEWLEAHVMGCAQDIANVMRHHQQCPDEGPFRCRLVRSEELGKGMWTLEVTSESTQVRHAVELSDERLPKDPGTWRPLA